MSGPFYLFKYVKEVEEYGAYIIYHSNYYLLNYDRTKKKYL